MNEIKGFINIDSLVDNSTNVVAPYGELSVYGRSYTKDRGTYVSASNAAIEAVVFNAYDGDTDKDITVTEAQSTQILTVAEWVALNIINSSFGGTKNDTVTSLRDYFYPEGITYLDIGELLLNDGVYAPDYVVWEVDDTRYTMWFADTSFRADYPHFNIDVIPPVTSVDDLLRPFDDLRPMLKSPMDITQEANTLKGNSVVTAFLMQGHTVYEKDLAENTVESYWGINIYGAEALSVDEQKSAIRAYVLDNSAYDMFVWSLVLPSIFVPNELYILPTWDKTSVVEQTIYGGMYSPCVSVTELSRLAAKYAVGYEPEHISKFAEHTPLIYKSLGSVTIGADTNIEDKFQVATLHPTYALIQSSNLDFNRIEPGTQEFIRWVYSTVIVAENYSSATVLTGGMSLVKRGGYEYITDSINGLTILVLTKGSYMKGEGHDWSPIDNAYYTPSVPVEPTGGTISIGDSYVSASKKLSLSGAVSNVNAGSEVTITIKDSNGDIVKDIVNVSDTFAYISVDINIEALEPGILDVTVSVIDIYSEVVTASKDTGYVISSGIISDVLLGYDNSSETLSIEARLTNCDSDAAVYYRFEDISSNVRDGYIRASDYKLNDDSIPFALPQRLINGALTVQLRVVDITGQAVEWTGNLDAPAAAGTITGIAYEDATTSVTAETSNIISNGPVTVTVTDSNGTSWSGDYLLSGGLLSTDTMNMRSSLVAGDISIVVSGYDYSGNLINSSPVDGVLSGGIGSFITTTGWYDGYTVTGGSESEDGQSNFILHGEVVNAPQTGTVTVSVVTDDATAEEIVAFDLTVAGGKFSIGELAGESYPDYWANIVESNYPENGVRIEVSYVDYAGQPYTETYSLDSGEGTHVSNIDITADPSDSGLLSISGDVVYQLHGSRVEVKLLMDDETIETYTWSYQPETTWEIDGTINVGTEALLIPSGRYTAEVTFTDITTSRELKAVTEFDYVTPLPDSAFTPSDTINGMTQILAGDTFGHFESDTYVKSGAFVLDLPPGEPVTGYDAYYSLGQNDSFTVTSFEDGAGETRVFSHLIAGESSEVGKSISLGMVGVVPDNDTTFKTITISNNDGDSAVLSRTEVAGSWQNTYGGTEYTNWHWDDQSTLLPPDPVIRAKVIAAAELVFNTRNSGGDVTIQVGW